MVTPFISQKFKFWSFVSMVLLVFVHAYNLDVRYLQPWTAPMEPLTPTTFIEYFLANGLFRFRIPMLFIISGYLYALHDTKPNKERIGKRLRTLLVPYALWSAFGLLLTYVLELFPYTQHLVASSHVVQIDDARMLVHDYHWYEVLARWVFFPVSYQLWFIRVLLIYNLAYPAIRWCVTHRTAQKIFFGVAFLLWLSTFGLILIEGEGLLFFSLGVWMQKTNFNIASPQSWLNPVGWGVVFLLCAAGKTVLAFTGQPLLGNAVFPVITVLHKITVASGLIACWYGLDKLVSYGMSRAWFVSLSAFSFIIYAAHAPLVAFLIDGMFAWLHFAEGYRLMAFVFLPLCILVLLISLGATLRKLTPKVYGVLTGGRGLA
ncbi:MAG: acyltransferase [Bacteroidetes bacterium]|nr:acyltransferase [Bacteroidota bacterium]